MFGSLCLCACVGLRLMSGAVLFPNPFPSYLLGRLSQWDAELARTASLVNMLALGFAHVCLSNVATTGRPLCA